MKANAQKKLTCPQCGRRYAEPADRCPVDGSPLYGPEVAARIGENLNNYKIHSILGEGGMGVVYQGEHAMLGKPVAIKVLHERFARREGAMDQFLREAQAASRVRHPNIVDVTDFGETPDGCIYFVMEYLEGESLEDVLGRDHHLELFNAVNVVRQVAHALAAAHDQGIVHLDLKPENIFLINREGRRRIVRRVAEPENRHFVVEPEGNYDFVKLLDFGVAKFTHDNLGPGLGTRAGMVFGTPHYMSPEQARGEAVDGRSDIYSLGILFYEMIIGEVPFEGDVALDILNAHVSTPPVPPRQRNPRVDEGTNRTILKAIAKDPRDRFQTMDELIAGLVDCFTDRVFLRDVHRLPGAVESGIVPPTRPIGGPGGDPIGPPPHDTSPSARAPVPHRKTARPSSLTEELQQLFVAGRPEPEALGNDLVARAIDPPASPIPLAAVKAAPPTGSKGEFGDEDYATERVSAQRTPATDARSDEDTPTGEFERATATPQA
ncbi:MAG: serine/threonine protein kinase, partial [Deltaproteobacteria bacterium]|nr:serine/threonine protein kinase [Deltaproteobacteria bacterium]